MRVICIDTEFFKEVPDVSSIEERKSYIPEIKIGERCTVIEEADYSGLHFYRFSEHVDESGKYKWWYDSRCFALLEN